MNDEEAVLNFIGKLMLDETKKLFAQNTASRAFNGQQKPIAGQLPPIFAPKNATSTFIDSLKYRVNIGADENTPLVELYSDLPAADDYGKYIDSGRIPGKGIPLLKMEQWMAAKNIVPQPLLQRGANDSTIFRVPTMKQLRFLLNRSILRSGIFPFPYEELVKTRIEKEVKRRMEPAVATIIERVIRERIVFIINPERFTR